MQKIYLEHTENQSYLNQYLYKTVETYDPTYDAFGELIPTDCPIGSHYESNYESDISIYSGHLVSKSKDSLYLGNKENVGSNNYMNNNDLNANIIMSSGNEINISNNINNENIENVNEPDINDNNNIELHKEEIDNNNNLIKEEKDFNENKKSNIIDNNEKDDSNIDNINNLEQEIKMNNNSIKNINDNESNNKNNDTNSNEFDGSSKKSFFINDYNNCILINIDNNREYNDSDIQKIEMKKSYISTSKTEVKNKKNE